MPSSVWVRADAAGALSQSGDDGVVTSVDDQFSHLVRELRETAQSVRRFHENDIDEIKQFRALGRRAGRELGWKVRTFQLDPVEPIERDVIVYVAVVDSTPLHQELMRVRGEKAVRKALKSPIWRMKG